MTSVLNVDTIADKAGTGPVALTKQQAAKAWGNVDQTGTQSINGSFQVSSITDNGVGQTEFAFTNSMSDANYVVSGISKDGGGYNDDTNLSADYDGAFSTSAFEVWCHHAESANDANFALMVVHGDLA